MRHLRQYRFLAVALTAFLTISQLACGGNVIKSLRVALASSGPLVDSLVAAGVINRDKATAIIADFTDGSQVALDLQTDFAAIAKDDPQAKALKLAAALKAARAWQAIVNRHDFAANDRIQNAANIVTAILASLVIFYSDAPVRTSARVPRGTVKAPDEQALERQLKQQVEDLKTALKP